MEKLSPRKRNKEVNRLVRQFLLDKRFELARKLNSNRYEIRKLADSQKQIKSMLADINRQIDDLGIRINEK